MKDLNGHNSFEIIQKLIDGEFSSTEAQEYSNIINSDAGLKSEYDKYHKIKNSINSDKKSQLDNSVPTSQMKNNLFKELNFGTGANTVANANRFNLSSLSWMLDFKTSVPAGIAFVVVSAFLLFNNSKESSTINKDNNKENTSKIAITKSSANSDEVVTKFNNKFDNSNNSTNLNSSKNHNQVTVYNGKNLDKNNNQKTVVKLRDKSIDKSIISKNQINAGNDLSLNGNNISNKNIKNSNNSNNGVINSEVKTETEIKTNNEDSNNTLLIAENTLNLNNFDINKEFDNISYSPNNKNINTIVFKSKYNKTDDNSKLGLTILSLSQNTNLGKDYVIAGYYKVNKGESYNLELGLEFNSVMLQTLNNNTSNALFGPGIGLRLQSNKILQSLIGDEFAEILNGYTMASVGSVTPGTYYKLSAGMQVKLFQVSNINFELMTGYEYFSLMQANSSFVGNRSGLVSGFVIKF